MAGGGSQVTGSQAPSSQLPSSVHCRLKARLAEEDIWVFSLVALASVF